ncbi:MAG: protein kinase [Gemmatimonadales bacterium]|nr:protein kinase [Gemmatimonadales bacterium]
MPNSTHRVPMAADDGRWERLEQLFDAALERPAGERRAWAAAQAADDPELAARLDRMLVAHDRPGVLDAPLRAMPEHDVRARLAAALAGRYELGDVLGVGGMASVFRARELKHDRSVVIKALQPGLAAIIGDARFADEVRISARLAHPHILALIDSGDADGIRYFVTPDVGGETLRARLERDGALPVPTAITILRDLAAALAHAHDAGVVHRDLKPDNVLVVGDHAFLLDFGVAKLEGPAARPTDPGLAIGTPGYMAPEQAAGAAVDARTDLYAWGLVARETLTGRRDPATPLPTGGGIPPTLGALIGATLAHDPMERPASAHHLVRALDAMLVTATPRPTRWRWVALAVLVAAVGWFVVQSRRSDVVADGRLPLPIAVAPLQNETGDSSLAQVGRLAADWVTQGLHEAGVQVVAWPAARAAVEAAPSGAAARVLREVTGAATAVVGSLYRTGDSLRIQVEVVATADGLVLAAPPPIVFARDSLASGIARVRERVMGALAVRADARLGERAALASRPPTYAAYREFDRALDDFEAYRYDEARRGMVAAWRQDTTFTAALVYAAYAAWNSSDRALSDSLLQSAAERRATLSPFHLAMTEHMLAAHDGDLPEALRAIRRAHELAPGSRAGYNLGTTLLALGRAAEARDVLLALDPDRGPMRGWPAYWSQRAYAAHHLGLHDAELADAIEMARRHPGQRVTGVIVARALAADGRFAALDSALAAHVILPPDTYWSYGAMLDVAGEELHAHGHPERAVAYLEQAVTWLRDRLAVDPSQRGHRYWLASALIALERFDEADRVIDALRRDDPDRFLYRGMAATVAAHRGRVELAHRLAEAAVPSYSRAEQLVVQARVASILGDREAAVTALAAARARGVPGWHWVHATAFPDWAAVQDDPRFRQLLAPLDATP